MFYYLYEIKNNLNGKIYVGVHKTQLVDDEYMGSGKVIAAAIKKYGITNFTKTILETFNNAEDMYAREKEVVNSEFLQREDVYNLRCGGTGGFDYINENKTDQERTRVGKLGQQAIKNKKVNRYSDQYTSPFSDKELHAELSRRANSPESIKKKKETWKKTNRGVGEKNSQYGKMWITDGLESKIISKNDVIPDGWNKGRVMNN